MLVANQEAGSEVPVLQNIFIAPQAESRGPLVAPRRPSQQLQPSRDSREMLPIGTQNLTQELL